MFFRLLPWKRGETSHQRQIIQRLVHRYDSKTASPRTQIKDSVFLIHVSRISSIPLKPLPFAISIFHCLFLGIDAYTHKHAHTHTHTQIYQEIDSRGWYRNRPCL